MNVSFAFMTKVKFEELELSAQQLEQRIKLHAIVPSSTTEAVDQSTRHLLFFEIIFKRYRFNELCKSFSVDYLDAILFKESKIISLLIVILALAKIIISP